MSQLEKNNVPAVHQTGKYIYFPHSEPNGVRILFAGNSITYHGVKTDIGWNNAWGMAASGEENDYVHLILQNMKRKGIAVDACICQIAEYEFHYREWEKYLQEYQAAADFRADILIVRAVENVPAKDFSEQIFQKSYEALIDFLAPSGKAILTTSFWKHPGDAAIRSVAEKRGYPCVELGDLGERNEMKAIGLFEHVGVQNHPGDLGMKAIADRICEVL